MPEPLPSLHILGSRQFGGADQFFVRLLRALDEAGQPVTAVTRPASPVASALGASGIGQIHLPLANGWDLWSLWGIRRLVGRLRPAVVQTYMGRATRLTRLPRRSPALHVARLGGYYKIDGYYRHAHAWVGNTRGLCDYLVGQGLPAGRVFHIGNFVPDPLELGAEQRAQLRGQWQLGDDAWVLLALGRLIDIKGFDDLLRALALLPATVGDRPWTVLIAGDGPLAEPLRNLAQKLGLAERLRWLGWQDPPDRCYAVADAFLCPSRREALGNVILEAWNYRLPVIATRTPGALELIEPEVSGLLCDIGDAAGLAARIRELLAAQAAHRNALGAAGHRYLASRCSRRAVVEAYLQLYAQLAAGGS